MSPGDIKALREQLHCTARELAAALGVEQSTVLAWESGELFPTKRFVSEMAALREKGPQAIPRKRKRGAPRTPIEALADPELWRLVRKLLTHPELYAATLELAKTYADPAD